MDLLLRRLSHRNHHVITEQDREKFIKQIPPGSRPRFDKEGRFSSFVKKKNASGGYIPNFANPLEDAIGREQAAGLPINQIRINQHSKLRNAGNPMGLAVTNTRDEPTGAIPNFAQRSNLTLGDMGINKSGPVEKSLKSLNNAIDKANKAIKIRDCYKRRSRKKLEKNDWLDKD